MAEGGCAAAMGNVNSNDNWQVHFRDTMRGGKFLNSWRMAELHAKEAPDRVWELETYGALFDRTPDGKISQRNFGGHEYPRLAHVGDRTGLELIRTMQQKIVSLQQDDAQAGGTATPTRAASRCSPSAPSPSCSPTRRDAIAGAFGYWRETGRVRPVQRARRSCSRPAASASRSRSPPTPGSTPATGMPSRCAPASTLLNMEFVQFHPTGMVWPPSVKGILVTESVRGDGGVLKNSEGKRFMFDYVPDVFRGQYAETEEEGDRWYTDPDNNKRPPELLPRDEVARAINSEVKAGRGSPHGGVFLDIASRLPAGGDPEAAAVDAPPVQGAGRRRHHRRADGGRPDLPLRHGRRRGRRRTPRPPPACPGCSPPVRSPAACTARTGSAATRCPTCWCSASRAGAGAAAYVEGSGGTCPAVDADAQIDAGRRAGARRRSSRTAARTRTPLHQELQQTMNDLVGIIRKARGDRARRSSGSRELKERAAARQRRGRPAVQPGLAPRARPAQHAAGQRVRRAGGADARRRAAAGTPATTTPRWTRVAAGQPRSARRRRRRRRGRASSRCRRCATTCWRSSRRTS